MILSFITLKAEENNNCFLDNTIIFEDDYFYEDEIKEQNKMTIKKVCINGYKWIKENDEIKQAFVESKTGTLTPERCKCPEQKIKKEEMI
jgi:hypothetical protein